MFAIGLCFAAASVLEGQTARKMTIAHGGAQQTVAGSQETFTGQVRVTPLFDATDTNRTSAASVTFEPRARSSWHTHPRGQRLIVTSGTGRVQEWGGPIEEIRAGDVVWTPPGVKHWHGAAPDSAMTHIAMQETDGRKAVDWMEKVSDDQYGATSAQTAKEAPSAARKAFGDIAPALAQYTDEVLFGQVWTRPGLSHRDRSLITVAALVAGYRSNELPFHLKRALNNGVSKTELIELITHLAFYSGWPTANTALPIARRVFQEDP
jgi:4-carboxymuconolactone decarboxylase